MAHLVAGAYGEAKRPELETRQRNQRPMIVYLNTIGLFRTVSRLHCASEVVIQEEHQCDEVHPNCGPCIRHDVSCDYAMRDVDSPTPSTENLTPVQKDYLNSSSDITTPLSYEQESRIFRSPSWIRRILQALECWGCV
ncbi:hypothetical protein V2W45_1339576 [Cenococcum geophilum]